MLIMLHCILVTYCSTTFTGIHALCETHSLEKNNTILAFSVVKRDGTNDRQTSKFVDRVIRSSSENFALRNRQNVYYNIHYLAIIKRLYHCNFVVGYKNPKLFILPDNVLKSSVCPLCGSLLTTRASNYYV